MPTRRLGDRPDERRVFIPTTAGSETADVGEPPDEYEVNAGASGGTPQWGKDIAHSYSVFLTGDSSIWFKDTSTALAFVRHDADHQVPVEAGRTYEAWAVFQADKADPVLYEVSARVEWMKADKTTMISNSSIYSDPVDELNTWQLEKVFVEAPEGAAFARISFGRIDDAFNAYFDEVGMHPALPLWEASLGGAQAIADNSLEPVEYSVAETIDVGFVTSGTGIGEATIEVAGWYHISAGVTYGNMADGSRVRLRLEVNGSAVRELWDFMAGGAGKAAAHGSTMLYLEEGDVVHVETYQNSGSSQNLGGDSVQTYFTGVLVQ